MAMAHAAKKRDVELPDLSVTVRGEYKGLGFKRLTLEAVSSHQREDLDRFLEQAIRYCYITNTLLRTPEVEFRVRGGKVIHAPPPPPG